MRLFRVEDNKVVGEVETTERLAGVYDGVHVARAAGDGDYVLDYGNGTVMDFSVSNGQPSQLGPESTRTVNLDDMPHRAIDRETVAGQTKESVGRFGAIFSDDDHKDDSQRPMNERGWDTSRPAAEEF